MDYQLFVGHHLVMGTYTHMHIKSAVLKQRNCTLPHTAHPPSQGFLPPNHALSLPQEAAVVLEENLQTRGNLQTLQGKDEGTESTPLSHTAVC